MFTSKVWTDDSRLLQESNLAARQPQGATSVIQAIRGEGLAQGPYVVARGGIEPTTFHTEGTDNLHLTNHAPMGQYKYLMEVHRSKVTYPINNKDHIAIQKSQYIWFGTRQQLDKPDLAALSLEFPTFVFSTSVRDLGVILDQELSFVEHITALTRSCFYHLRQLRVVSRSLSASSTATL